MFEGVLVANRGEIARRVVRTLRALGVRSVAVHTPVDRAAPHVREADDAIDVLSYLDVAALVQAALRTGVQAIHPGYGFLSENGAFARSTIAAGLAWVGPPAEAIELMGDKVRAKAAAQAAGLPVVPSFTIDEARDGAPYPLLVKAAAGGGGRGMRVVAAADELDAALDAARREALAGFGDDTVFIERFLPRARHIEVQVIADAHANVLHLGERECSLQRRHQKLVEEAPSPVVGPELRARLGEEAVALARAAGYVGAGTVEFIADAGDPDEHYFLEMNTRLQVEHPVTELVYDVDLVELQLRVAAGEWLPLTQDTLLPSGHAIEVRVNAEDPANGFLPAAGRVLAYKRAKGPHIRVDDAIEQGSVVGTDYDSLLGKVIVHAQDRDRAIARLDRALSDTAILGVTTNTAFLRRLLSLDAVRAGDIDTGLVERLDPAPPLVGDEEVAAMGALISTRLYAEDAGDDPFARVDGWRLAGMRAWTPWRLSVDGGEPIEVLTRTWGGNLQYGGPAVARDAAIVRTCADGFAITTEGERREWTYALEGRTLWLGRGGHAFNVNRASTEQAHADAVQGALRAPMPGQVLLVPRKAGDRVEAGDPVVVLESMKMELSIVAPSDGVVTEVNVAVGDRVGVDQPLAHVEADRQ